MALYSITAKVQGSRTGWQIANEKSQDPTQTRTTTPSSGGKKASSDTTLQTEDLTEAFGTVRLCLPLRQKRWRYESKPLKTRPQGPNRMFETFSSRRNRQGRTATTRSEKRKKLITCEEYKRNKHSRRLAENHITDYGKEQMCRQIPEHYFR
jgi:Mg-chelatase subunit ChlI